ncbi:MAG TPA: efflux RND transporter periplasmic adaptor subunit [Bryobacteraceae bacterium]|jgi:RND family efflux transporter MFP subunit
MGTNPQIQPEPAEIRRPADNKSHHGFLVVLLVAAIALGGAIFYELSVRKTQERALAASIGESATAAPPSVNVAKVRIAASEATVDLPGQTMALLETPVYARTDGYIKQRYVEIGDRVKRGQPLIELDTPDLDQQIVQARATLGQSRAALAQLQANLQAAQSSLKLSKITAERTKALADQGVMSRQDNDTAQAALENGQANVHAAEESIRAQQDVINANDANLNRLIEEKKFAHIEAPFDGVITYRNTAASDVGTLVSSGSSTATHELFRISQIQTLRIFVNVPQSYAPVIRVNQPAKLAVEEFPGRAFPARVTSAASAVDPTSRTMLTILEVDNSSGSLLPGMYATVSFRLPHTVNALRVPGDALMFRTEGVFAAVVDRERHVHMRKLTLGRDYGAEVEATSGLEAMDSVILNPTDAIREGVVVDPKERAEK